MSTLKENTHVTFRNEHGGEEVGIVKSFADGEYTIERRNKETVKVPQDKVHEIHVSSQDKEACPAINND